MGRKKRFYVAAAYNICDYKRCGQKHATKKGARRCAKKFKQDPLLGQRLIRVFGYEGDDITDKPVYREEISG